MMRTEQSNFIRRITDPEFNLLRSSNTIGGALVHLKSLLEKVRASSLLKPIILQVEGQIAEEERLAYENFEKSVDWYHSKIRMLLPFTRWKKKSWEVRKIHSLLEFNIIVLGPGGYIGLLNNELRFRIVPAVIENVKSHHLFKGWAKPGKCSRGKFCIDELCFPEFVEKEVIKPPLEEQIYQWKERADTCLQTLLRFLKILSLYDSFVPLVLPGDSRSCIPIKSLEELARKQYQAYVGYYLSLFRSSDENKHPLKHTELERLVERFLYMLDQKIEFNRETEETGGPLELNLTLNQVSLSSVVVFEKEKVQEQEADRKTDPCLVPSDNDEKVLEQSKLLSPRTKQVNEDINALIPFAKKIWEKDFPSNSDPMHMSSSKLVEKLLTKLPQSVSLHTKGGARRPRAKRAIKLTDPRIFKGGKYLGPKPHWEKFAWVKA